jgi:tight adherence protein B
MLLSGILLIIAGLLAGVVIMDLPLFPRVSFWSRLAKPTTGKFFKYPGKKSRAEVEQLLARAGLRINYGEYLLLSIGGVSLGVLVGQYLNNWFITIICGYLGFKIPQRVLRYLQDRRKALLSMQMEPALQQIANLYRISQSMEQALEQAVLTMASPLKDEFQKTLSDIRVAGMSLEEALVRLAARLGLRDFDFFVKITLLAQKFGGETKELMLQIPQTIRERQMIRAELETEVAGAKQQAWLLMSGTPLFFVVYKLLRPDFAQMLTETTPGKLGMAVVALLSLISVLLIEKITEPIT